MKLDSDTAETLGATRHFAAEIGLDVVQASLLTPFPGTRGIDKHCRIVIALRRAPKVVIEDTAPDMETAIDRGADRAQRAVARVLERRREAHRSARSATDGESAW